MMSYRHFESIFQLLEITRHTLILFALLIFPRYLDFISKVFDPPLETTSHFAPIKIGLGQS